MWVVARCCCLFPSVSEKLPLLRHPESPAPPHYCLICPLTVETGCNRPYPLIPPIIHITNCMLDWPAYIPYAWLSLRCELYIHLTERSQNPTIVVSPCMNTKFWAQLQRTSATMKSMFDAYTLKHHSSKKDVCCDKGNVPILTRTLRLAARIWSAEIS